MGGNENELGTRSNSLWLSDRGSLRGDLSRVVDRIPFQKGVGGFCLVSNRSVGRGFTLLVLVACKLFLSLTLDSFIVLIDF